MEASVRHRVVDDMLLYCCKLIFKYERGGGKRNWSGDATCHSRLCKKGNFFRNASPSSAGAVRGVCVPMHVQMTEAVAVLAGETRKHQQRRILVLPIEGPRPAQELPALCQQCSRSLSTCRSRSPLSAQLPERVGSQNYPLSFPLVLSDKWPRSSFLFTFGSQHFPTSGIRPRQGLRPIL